MSDVDKDEIREEYSVKQVVYNPPINMQFGRLDVSLNTNKVIDVSLAYIYDVEDMIAWFDGVYHSITEDEPEPPEEWLDAVEDVIEPHFDRLGFEMVDEPPYDWKEKIEEVN